MITRIESYVECMATRARKSDCYDKNDGEAGLDMAWAKQYVQGDFSSSIRSEWRGVSQKPVAFHPKPQQRVIHVLISILKTTSDSPHSIIYSSHT